MENSGVFAETSEIRSKLGRFWSDKNNNPYDPAWHSFNIYRLNGKYAIQTAGNAGGRMWTADEERINLTDAKSVGYEHFIFEIIPVGGAATETPMVEPGAAVYIIDNEGRYLTNTTVKVLSALSDASRAQIIALAEELMK